MLDRLEKTTALLDAMEQALPFKVRLTPELINNFAKQERPLDVQPVETVTDIFYAGDEGGIMCSITPSNAKSVVVVSLTHLSVPRNLPFAAAAHAYQKQRVKKFKYQKTL